MGYSNGYDITAVTAALKDRVGFRQPLGTGSPTLTTAVTTSNSGRYYQDFHSLVTVDNIKATMPQVNASDADLITYLGQLRMASILRALNGVFSQPDIVDQPALLFNREGKNDVAEPNAGKFIGYEIEVANTHEAAVQFETLYLLFDAAVTFNVYLFKDGDETPVWTQSVTVAANTIKEVSLTDKIVNSGTYYIGYFQNDLGSARALRQQVDDWHKAYFFEAEPIMADSTGATTFNRNQISYTDPIGLNIEMSSFRDHTKLLVKKSSMFDELIGLTMAYSVIEQIIYAVRENKAERFLKDQLDKVGIQLDLNGTAPISDSPRVTGLKQRIEREAEKVRNTFHKQFKSTVVSLC